MRRSKLLSIVAANLKKEGIRKAYLFGSYARKEQGKNSDIDILVDFEDTKSLLEMARIERELSEKTGKKIDLLTRNSISPLILKYVEKEMISLFK